MFRKRQDGLIDVKLPIENLDGVMDAARRWIRIGAGGVQPVRTERIWLPGFIRSRPKAANFFSTAGPHAPKTWWRMEPRAHSAVLITARTLPSSRTRSKPCISPPWHRRSSAQEPDFARV